MHFLDAAHFKFRTRRLDGAISEVTTWFHGVYSSTVMDLRDRTCNILATLLLLFEF